MMRKIIGLLFISCLAMTGCDDATIDAPNTVSSGSTGVIRSFVELVNDQAQEIADRSGVTVKLNGTTMQTLTDPSGNWILAGVPSGIYTLTLSKPGFVTSEQQVQFIGKDTLTLGGKVLHGVADMRTPVISGPERYKQSGTEKWVEFIRWHVKQDTVLEEDLVIVNSKGVMDTLRAGTLLQPGDSAIKIFDPSNTFWFKVSLPSNGKAFRYFLVFSREPNVDVFDPSRYQVVEGDYIAASGQGIIPLYEGRLRDYGVQPGERVYVTVRSISNILNYGYAEEGDFGPPSNEIEFVR